MTGAEGERHHGIFILVNDKRVGPFSRDTVTGAEIKEKGGFDLNSDLYKKQGTELVLVRNDQTVEIHENEQFVDLTPTPVS